MSPALTATLEKSLLAALSEPDFLRWLEASDNDVSPAGAAATSESVAEMSTFYNQFKNLLE